MDKTGYYRTYVNIFNIGCTAGRENSKMNIQRAYVIPSFENLLLNYPKGTAEEIKKGIGGKVNLPWLTNTCVVRISKAFNYSGQTIPKNFDGLETAEGGDGFRYAYRVDEFETFLTKRYGNPILNVKEGKLTDNIKDRLGRYKGIIMFKVDGKGVTGKVNNFFKE
jgi:hypothetical protein